MFRLSEYFYKYLAEKADRKRGGKAKLKAKRNPETNPALSKSSETRII